MELNYRLGRAPTSAEIAEELDLPSANWNVVRETVLSNSQPVHSMNEDASSVHTEMLEDTRSKTPEEEIFSTLELTRLLELLENIDRREARNADCIAEVELNRRLSPAVYLGLAPLLGGR